MIWSDEAHFELFNRENHTFVHRLQTESEHPFNFVPKVQEGGGYVNVWGCMFSGACGPFVTYSGKVDEPAYVKIIEEALLLFIEYTFDGRINDFPFMHNNAPPHRSKFGMQWLKGKGIKVLK